MKDRNYFGYQTVLFPAHFKPDSHSQFIPASPAKDCCEHPGFLGWQAVGAGKPAQRIQELHLPFSFGGGDEEENNQSSGGWKELRDCRETQDISIPIYKWWG